MTDEQPLCALDHHDAEPRAQVVGRVCEWHRARMDRVIADIRRDWIDVQMLREAGSAPKDSVPRTRHVKQASPPAPANLDVLVMRDPRSTNTGDECPDGIDYTGQPLPPGFLTEVYCTRIIQERPLTQIVQRRTRLDDGRIVDVPRTVPAVVPYGLVTRLDMLKRHHDWIAGQDFVGEYLEEFSKLRKDLKNVLRDKEHIWIGSDPYAPLDTQDTRCGGALLRKNGSETVRCFRCKRTWTTPLDLARLQVALESRRGA